MKEKDILNLLKTFKEMESNFYEPIGHYVFEFGRIEHWIDVALSNLMNVNHHKVGRYPLHEIDFLARVKLLRVLARGSGSDIEAELKAATNEMEEQNTFRNNLVHGPWVAYLGVENPNGAWQKPGLSRRFHSTYFTVSLSDIKTKTDRLPLLMSEINQLVERITTLRIAQDSPNVP